MDPKEELPLFTNCREEVFSETQAPRVACSNNPRVGKLDGAGPFCAVDP